MQVTAQALALLKGRQRALLFDEGRLRLLALGNFGPQLCVGRIEFRRARRHARLQVVDQVAQLCGQCIERPRQKADLVRVLYRHTAGIVPGFDAPDATQQRVEGIDQGKVEQQWKSPHDEDAGYQNQPGQGSKQLVHKLAEFQEVILQHPIRPAAER